MKQRIRHRRIYLRHSEPELGFGFLEETHPEQRRRQSTARRCDHRGIVNPLADFDLLHGQLACRGELEPEAMIQAETFEHRKALPIVAKLGAHAACCLERFARFRSSETVPGSKRRAQPDLGLKLESATLLYSRHRLKQSDSFAHSCDRVFKCGAVVRARRCYRQILDRALGVRTSAEVMG